MKRVIFLDAEHEAAFDELLSRMRSNDVYRRTLAYLLTLDEVCRRHIDDLYDFEENCIKPDTAFDHGWQTGTSRKTTRLAYNLYTDSTGWCDDAGSCSVSEIMCCSYAPYYWQAIQIRYPEYATN